MLNAKKSKSGRGGQEYPLMREAIGQLMTSSCIAEGVIPVVAVPDTAKARELTERWSRLMQIKTIGIRFAMVQDSGKVDMIY